MTDQPAPYEPSPEQEVALLHAFFTIAHQRDQPFSDKVRAMLVLVNDHLGTEVAIVSHIDQSRYEVVEVHSPNLPLKKGQRFELKDTYCAITFQRAQVIASHHVATGSPWKLHPAYRAFSLEAYVGITVFLDERPFGTLSFSSRAPRPAPFSAAHLALVDRFAAWLGHELSVTQRHERARQELVLAKQLAEVARDRAMRASQSTQAFLANVSHELRTPLNGILGMGALLLDTSLDERQRAWATLMQRSGEHLLALINDVLDLAQMEADRVTLSQAPFSPLTLVEEITTLLSPLSYKKGLYLDVSLAACVPSQLLGDALRIRQVLINLIGNAIKFTESGGVFVHVWLSAHHDDQLTLRFDVQDTGPGIKEADLSLIFEPFHQLDGSASRTHQGTGLGLAVSRRLVEMMGGELLVRSSPGQGSLFSMIVPLLACQDNAPALTPSAFPCQVWVESAQPTLKEGLSAACSRYGATMAPSRARCELLLLDLAHPELDSLITTLRSERAGLSYQIHLLKYPHEPIPSALDGLINGCLDKPLRQKQLLKVFERIAHHEPHPKDGLSVVTLSMESSPQDLAGYNLSAMLLPTYEAAPVSAPSAAPVDAIAPKASAPPKLLIAEDNFINAQVIEQLVRRLGCTPHLVTQGNLALEAFAAERFDLVLLDCQMPLLDGYETARQLRLMERTLNTRTPIIALTASAMPHDRQRALDAGMDDFLTKPIALATLQTTLRAWLGHLPAHAAAHTRAAQAEPRLEVLNIKVFERLANELQDMPLLHELVREHFEQLDTLCGELREAIDQDARSRVVKLAHHLKGSASVFGFEAIVVCCRELELLAREGGAVGLEASFQALQMSALPTRRAVEAQLAGR